MKEHVIRNQIGILLYYRELWFIFDGILRENYKILLPTKQHVHNMIPKTKIHTWMSLSQKLFMTRNFIVVKLWNLMLISNPSSFESRSFKISSTEPSIKHNGLYDARPILIQHLFLIPVQFCLALLLLQHMAGIWRPSSQKSPSHGRRPVDSDGSHNGIRVLCQGPWTRVHEVSYCLLSETINPPL
jgi:hypothetical protein